MRLFKGIDLTAESLESIVEITGQLSEDKELSPTDTSLLQELAETIRRSSELQDFAKIAKEEKDVEQYMKLSRMIDAACTQKRGLLKDLKATRIATAVDTASKVSEKAKSASGQDWKGVV